MYLALLWMDRQARRQAQHAAHAPPAPPAPYLRAGGDSDDDDDDDKQIVPHQQPDCDVLIIGSGAAGLAVAVAVESSALTTLMVEASSTVGGNSICAASGISALPVNTKEAAEEFLSDLDKCGGQFAPSTNRDLRRRLMVGESYDLLQWVREHVGVKLSQTPVRTGGHTVARTYVMADGAPIGRCLVEQLTGVLKWTKILKKHSVAALRVLSPSGFIECSFASNLSPICARHVVIATGGYAGSQDGLLATLAPAAAKLCATTNCSAGPWVGSGLRLGQQAGGHVSNLDSVQIHPTAFDIDQTCRLPLCPERVRADGAVLVNGNGHRFIDELLPRGPLVAAMLSQGHTVSATCSPGRCWIIIDKTTTAATLVQPFVQTGLLVQCIGAKEAASVIRSNGGCTAGYCDLPASVAGSERGDGEILVGCVRPAAHYSLGGLSVDTFSRVVDAGGVPVAGGCLSAVGESAAGVHGTDRLAGVSLLECLYFGRRLGTHLGAKTLSTTTADNDKKPPYRATVTLAEARKMANSAQKSDEGVWGTVGNRVVWLSSTLLQQHVQLCPEMVVSSTLDSPPDKLRDYSATFARGHPGQAAILESCTVAYLASSPTIPSQ